MTASPGDSPDTGAPGSALSRTLWKLARVQVTGGRELDAIFRRECELVAQALDVERVGIWLFDAEGRAIRCHHLYEHAQDQHSTGATLQAEDFPAYFRALRFERCVAVRDVRESPDTAEMWAPYFEILGIASTLDVAIYREGRIAGVVCHEHRGDPRDWTEQEKAFAASVADRIAMQFEEAARRDAEQLLVAHEQHLVELHRMEALGRLAAGVAHDFNNLLTIILASAARASTDATPSRREEALADVSEAAQRGARLVRELVSFAQNGKQSPRVVDVGAVLQPLAGLLQRSVGSKHQIALKRPAATGRTLIDESQLERLVMNLVMNARDAMPEGGTIAIEIEEAEVDDGPAAPGTWIVLSVRDQGHGIDDETREHLFEPFFTTKGPGRGSGLGLSIVHRIVERCGGFIRVESAPGKGATFRVHLPRIGV